MKKLWDRFGAQFLRFGLVGVVNTLVDMFVYWLALKILGTQALLGDKNYLIAQLLGFAAGTLNAYFMNGRFVFGAENPKRNRGKRQLLRTFVGYGFTFALSELLLWIWISNLGLNEMLAKVLNLFVTVPLNFVINRFWTFAQKPED
ncbi:MAG: GtrA family protein [Clostridia bacterium]|nr:GtrA family protein [Clostridia bacterium]